MATVRERPIEAALPHLRETHTLETLLGAITHLARNYDLEEYMRAKGPTSEITLASEHPGEQGVMIAYPKRSFREETWYRALSPAEQRDAELEILRHLHTEVKKYTPEVYERSRRKSKASGTLDIIREFEGEFGFPPPEGWCVAHTQLICRIGSAIGFECGMFTIPDHVVALVRTKPRMMVSDAMYDSPMSITEWEDKFMNDPDQWAVEIRRKFIPAGKRLFSVLNPISHYMGEKVVDAHAHSNLGYILRQQVRLEEAEHEYRRAIDACPGFENAHESLGSLLLGAGRLEEAEAEFRETIRINPRNPEAHFNLGYLFEEKGLLEEAEREYRMAIKMNLKYERAHNYLMVLLHRTGRLDEFFEASDARDAAFQE